MLDRINKSIQMWHQKTCVRFLPNSDALTLTVGHWDHIQFAMSNNGCTANVGRCFDGKQFVNVSSQCGVGTIVHELGHALGFVHEQSRPDRDLYVHIDFNNVQAGKSGQFLKYNNREVTTYNLPYDVGSIMHYSSQAYTRDPGLRTITTYDPLVERWMGQRSEISFLDAKLANMAYRCNQNCLQKLSCNNGGYIGPACTCICPDGLSGITCDQAIVSRGCGGVLRRRAGVIQSSNYPNPYSVNEMCSWVIMVRLDN